MEKIFFDSWESLLRTAIITVLAYASLIVFLRISGKRTLSKMNAFDYIVTIALGSTLASMLLNKDVALLDGLLAFALLIGLQFLITFLATRSEKVSELVKSTPTLLAHNGQVIRTALRKERITEDEVMAIVRQAGLASLDEAGAVVLETDGSLTVVKGQASLQHDALSKVQRQ